MADFCWLSIAVLVLVFLFLFLVYGPVWISGVESDKERGE